MVSGMVELVLLQVWEEESRHPETDFTPQSSQHACLPLSEVLGEIQTVLFLHNVTFGKTHTAGLDFSSYTYWVFYLSFT